MSQITVNNVTSPSTYYTTRIIVTHLGAALAEVNSDADGIVLVTTTTACTITAILGPETASTAIDITNAIAVIASDSDGFSLSKSEANAPTNTITLKNRCTETVQFLFSPADAPTQSYAVPANESLTINTAEQWTVQAYITMKGVVTDGATNAVGFNDPNATVSIVVDENNDYSLKVTAA